MKRTTRRLLSLLMAVVLCLGLTPVTAWAANFPSKFYASITFSSSSSTESFGTVSSNGTYTKTGTTKNRVIYGMEYAGGVFFTVEGTRGESVSQGGGDYILTDDGWRELRMYNSDLTSYRVIGDVSPKDKPVYAIVDTAIDLSGEAPVLYGTYNQTFEINGQLMASTIICKIDLTDGHTSDWLQVDGLSSASDIIYAIAFDKNGTLYAIGADGGASGGEASLYTIELGEKQATAEKVADIKSQGGSAISTNFAQDMAFDHASGTLYWAENKENEVYTVDTSSAVATQVGQVKYSNKAYALQSFCIPYDTAFAGDQHMVSVIYTGGGAVTGSGENKPFYMVENGEDLTLALTPDKNGKLLSVKVDGKSVSVDNLTEYTFSNVTANHVIEVTFRDNLPVTQKDMTWFHYQGYPASFYTQHHAYKFYELPYTTDAPKDGYTQTLQDKNGRVIPDDECIIAGDYDVRVTHLGNENYNALDVVYENALQLAKCPGTPGRPVVYGKVGCTQGDLTTTSALQDYYGTDGKLIDAAHDEIPVTLVWLNPETEYNTAGNFYANATIYAADELDERILACYNLDDGVTPISGGCQISSRATQVVVLPADQASLIKVRASDDAGGTVSGKGVYKNDDEVTVTATVANGYAFEGWQEDGELVSNEPTYTFTAERDRTLTAVFTLPTKDYTVHLSVDPTGAGAVTGGGSYEDVTDNKATVTATPNTGYYFMGWYKAGETEATSTNTEYSFEVPQEGITLIAKFGVDLLARAELAKDNLESSLGTSVFEWSTLTDAVDAYEKAKEFVEGPPSGVVDAQTRFEALTGYYSGVKMLDLSDLGLNNEDLMELYLFTGVTELNLSGNKDVTSLSNLNMAKLETLDLSNTVITDLSGLSAPTKLETLDLSNNTALTDLSGLSTLKNLKTLNLSGDKGITDLSGLRNLGWLETLDVSSTGVTAFDTLVNENGKLVTPSLKTLTAQKLSLTSLSALAGLQEGEMFWFNINSWDFTNSTLPDTEGSKTDVETIQSKLGDKFIPPTPKTNPTPGGGGGGAVTYGIVVADCEHGKISAEPAKAAQGDTVTISVTPDEGYELESLAVSDAGGKAVEVSRNDDGTFSFEMPASNVTVTASFAAEPAPWENPFSDVAEADWFYADVAAVSERGVMAGYGGTDLFGPYDGTTRAMAATVIWRLAGEPEVDYAVPFADVEEGQWYTEAVRWAASTGVAAGYGGTDLFGTDDPVTREQFATMLSRFAQAAGLAPVEPGDLSAFSDAAEVSEWGAEGMAWAVGAGVVRGVDDSHLAPQSGALRCELAAMLNRTIEGFDL